ncbi:AMP-binding protein [Nocardioides zeae]|uniref:Propionyl-CoA synthetase n=1 Tax=Nocardioides zeae TaxID=1457234 RepID=A0A6P0HP52_9ACTN|nr:AMP-binding protein [Nocardioides zeae]NEN80090.1 propionyl-CoA synthetase [Nocardioides zeae]
MTNLAYDALDLHVIRGRAEAPAVSTPDREVDYATVLEEVGALAGAMRALGVAPGASVLVALADEYDELLAFLAALRLRAVPVLVERVHAAVEPEAAPAAHLPSAATLAVRHRPHLVVSAVPWPGHVHRPAAVLYRGPEPQDPETEVAWELALRAGRTDPAPASRADEVDEPPTDAHEAAAEACAYVVGNRAVLHREVPEAATQVGRRLGGLLGGRPVTLGR